MITDEFENCEVSRIDSIQFGSNGPNIKVWQGQIAQKPKQQELSFLFMAHLRNRKVS